MTTYDDLDAQLAALQATLKIEVEKVKKKNLQALIKNNKQIKYWLFLKKWVSCKKTLFIEFLRALICSKWSRSPFFQIHFGSM